MAERSMSFDGRIDLRATFATMAPKTVGREVQASHDEAWWLTNAPQGPATLVVQKRPRELRAEAWGPGATWALDRLPHLCGIEDDPERFTPPPGLVADLHRRNRGLRLGASHRVFEALVPVILGQRVTSLEAGRSYRTIVAAFGTPAPGPIDAMVPPAAAVMAELSYADLHPHGVERARAQVIIEAARRAARLEETVEMSYEGARARLTSLRGIGDWSAALVLGAALGDPDAVPTGDYHIPDMVSWALAGEPRASDERMLELLEPYAGHRRRVLILLNSARIHAPRYGPKTAPRNFSRS